MSGILIEATANPDYANLIGYIVGQTSQFVVLSAVIVGIVNQIKSSLPVFLKKHMRVFAVMLGIGSLFLMNVAFDMLLSIHKTIFFGFIMGLSSVGLYEAGLGKKLKNIDSFDLSQ